LSSTLPQWIEVGFVQQPLRYLGVKYDKAVELLAFYDFPAEYWKHTVH
jgi:hypothetical protein